MRELNTPEMNRLSGYLEAMVDFLIGVNYVTHFETKGFVLAERDFVAQSIVKSAYPESEPEHAEVLSCSVQQMIERLNTSFTLPDPPYSDGDFRKEITENLSRHYLSLLKACVDYERALIVEYRPSDGVNDELWDFIYWGFTFLIYNAEQGRCVIIHGAASD